MDTLARCTTFLLAILAAFSVATARGDAITIDGTRYEGVLVRESPTRYYVWIPAEERTISASKDKASDVSLTQEPAARLELIQKWTQWQQQKKIGGLAPPGKTGQDPTALTENGEDPSTREVSQASATPPGSGSLRVPPLQEILAAYAGHQDRLLRFTDTYHLEEIVDSPRRAGSRKGTQLTDGQLAYNGVQYMQAYTFWSPPSPPEVAVDPTVHLFLFDGKAMWSYLGGVAASPDGSPRGRVKVRHDVRACPELGPYYFENPRYNFTIRNYHGREALGFLVFWCESDARRVDEILGATVSARVRANTERVEGSECYVADVDLAKGTLSVWFDPAREYNVAKASWLYRPGAGREHPDWRILKWQETYRVQEYMQAQDLCIPRETIQERHIDYANGEKEERVYRFRRMTFEANPDSAGHNPFTLIDKLDDGTEVSQRACAAPDANSAEHRDPVVRQYIWKRGKLLATKPDARVSMEAQASNAPLLTEIP